jgi:hypothetical protein
MLGCQSRKPQASTAPEPQPQGSAAAPPAAPAASTSASARGLRRVDTQDFSTDALCDSTTNDYDTTAHARLYTCYAFGWKPWVKHLAQRTAGPMFARISGDSGTQAPGHLVVAWDDEPRVVYWGCRAHDCPDAFAYYVVAPKSRQLDIAWRNESGVKYLGPNADFLRKNKAIDWLNAQN